ncbi:MAG: hypothetical protein UFG06_02495 [Lachnospiraceae bacterium]|nr:hypothetical protein [Lachnospiraceae bacterium]
MSNKLVKSKKSPPKTNEGIAFYNQIGRIFIFLGIVSFIILGFVSLLPQDYEKYNIPLFYGIWAVISSIFVIIGVLPLLLGKYCKKYQIWIEKEVKSYQNRMLKQTEKLIEKDMRKHK